MIEEEPKRTSADIALNRQLESLKRNLGPVAMNALVDPNVKELMLNPDGSFWIEYLGGKGMVKQSTSISPTAATMFMNTLAAMFEVTMSSTSPILECELPIDGSRFEGICSPVVAKPTFSIRKKASRVFTLDEYVSAGIITGINDPTNKRRGQSMPFHERCKGLDHRQVIELAVRLRLNILVIGATGSGKTTLLNAIAEAISRLRPWDRMLIIEDTGEIMCSAPNNVILRATEHASMNRCLRAAMRLNPTSVSVGEARGPEVKVWVKACNTGHPGGFATVHADDAKLGIKRVEALWEEDGTKANKVTIGDAIDLVIFIDEEAGIPAGRKVREIVYCDGFDMEKQDYKLIYV